MIRNTRDLVEAAQRGDKEAFGLLVERHYGTVAGVALATVREWNAAQDVAQDAFVSAWAHLSQLRQPEAFPMWIRKIARNLALNWRQSEQYRRRVAERYSRERSDATTEPDAVSRVISEERREALLHVMDTLSGPVAEVMVLHYLQERSVLEIGVALGISESAVKKRLQRGREALRDRLESSWKADIARGESSPTRAAARNILMGLSAGPAMPQLSQHAAAYGPMVLAHHVAHGGALGGVRPALAAGMVGGGKTAVAAGIVVLAAVVAWWGLNSGESPAPPDEGAMVRVAADGAESAGTRPESSADGTLPGGAAPNDRAGGDVIDVGHRDGDATEAPIDDAENDGASAARTRADARARDEAEKPPTTMDVHGIVVTEWDEPVSGVRVVAMPRRGEGALATPEEMVGDLAIQFDATTDPSGEFQFVGVEELQAYRAIVVDREFAGEDTFQVLEDDIPTVRIVAKRGVALDGRLVTPSGEGVPAAFVESLGLIAGNSAQGGPLAQTLSDDEGYFTLLFQQAGEALVRTVAKNYGEQIFPNVPVGAPEVVTLTLDTPARLSGRVTTEAGEPVSGALVVLEAGLSMAAPSGSTVHSTGSVVSVRANDDGFYVFDHVATNTVHDASVRLESELKLTSPHTIGPLASDEEAEWNPVLSGEAKLVGAVLGAPSGAPVAGSRVFVMAGGEQFTMVETLPDGSYEVNVPLAVGQVTLVPAYALLPVRELAQIAPEVVVDHTLTPGDPNEVDLVLPDPYCVTFRTVDTLGNPVGGADVDVNWKPHDNSTYGFGSGWTTNDAGVFEWCGAAPYGAYIFRARSEAGVAAESAPYTGAPGDVFEEEVLVLFESGGLSGQLIDAATGNPLANTRIRLTNAEKPGSGMVESTATAEDGYFRIAEGIPATEWIIRIRVESGPFGQATWISPPITVEADHVLDLGAIPMAAQPTGGESFEDETVDIELEP